VGILPKVEAFRIEANSRLDKKKKSSLGQFFTPAPICQFMASLFTNIKGDINLLDPGCGVGSLLTAFNDEALKRGEIDNIKITAYDIEDIIEPYINDALTLCKEESIKHEVNFTAEFIKEDFILETSQFLSPTLFSEQKEVEKFTHVIMNPPYKKIATKSEHRQALRKAGIETVNLYSGFVALAIKMLKPKGELVAIIPRSFCNGPYYKPFRELLIKETAVERIHIFDTRNKAFADNEVLQENIILHCIKGGKQDKVKITSSSNADFYVDNESGKTTVSDMMIRTVDFYDNIVNSKDNESFIHIATSQSEQYVIDRLSCFNNSLKDIDLEVSTGPVVDFRLKDDLRENIEEDAVPLLYPIHLNGGVNWPKVSKKPNAICISEKSKSWLWEHKGSFVLVRRFSTKEEKRRIVATYYDSSLGGELIGFENKLNVFHINKVGFDAVIAKGLFVFLNSSLLDQYYRQFGGHTQVNATDLRSLHYPSIESLKNIGSQLNDPSQLSQQEIDSLLDDEITSISGSKENIVLLTKEKLNDAFEILNTLKVPKDILNERLALTFLALLDLQPNGNWDKVRRPALTLPEIMNWTAQMYGKEYDSSTTETFRAITLKFLLDSGMLIKNPDNPNRNPESPKNCFQLTTEIQNLVMNYKTNNWSKAVSRYFQEREGRKEMSLF
jgi:adenine-specific DNA-methyltransferase